MGKSVKIFTMNILVTGGAGFIGSNIVDRYVQLGHRVSVVDNLSTGDRNFVNKAAAFYRTDIRNRSEIEKIMAKEKPDIINLHAAQISVRKSVEDPAGDADINLLGLLSMLESARKNRVKKVIFASSGGVVYGEASAVPTPESYTPLLPTSPYGVSKLASEYYLSFYEKTYKMAYVALRYANVYGPRQNPHGEAGVVAIFTKKLLGRSLPTINGDGKQTRDYVFVGDVVAANERALEYPGSGSFNIGTGIETDVNGIFQSLKRITGSKVEAVHGPAKAGEQQKSCLDNRLAGKILNWKPRVLLNEGLEQTVSYFRNCA